MKKLLAPLMLMLVLASCTETDPLEPEVDPRDKFLGTWTVQEKIDGQVSGAYQSEVIYDSGNTSRIRINNIYNLGSQAGVTALIAGNSVDISSQTITGIIISGTGLFSGDGFTLNYTASDGSQVNTVQAVHTK